MLSSNFLFWKLEGNTHSVLTFCFLSWREIKKKQTHCVFSHQNFFFLLSCKGLISFLFCKKSQVIMYQITDFISQSRFLKFNLTINLSHLYLLPYPPIFNNNTSLCLMSSQTVLCYGHGESASLSCPDLAGSRGKTVSRHLELSLGAVGDNDFCCALSCSPCSTTCCCMSENASMVVRRSNTRTLSKPPLKTLTYQQSHGNRLHRIKQSGEA